MPNLENLPARVPVHLALELQLDIIHEGIMSARQKFLETGEDKYFQQMLQLLESYRKHTRSLQAERKQDASSQLTQPKAPTSDAAMPIENKPQPQRPLPEVHKQSHGRFPIGEELKPAPYAMQKPYSLQKKLEA